MKFPNELNLFYFYDAVVFSCIWMIHSFQIIYYAPAINIVYEMVLFLGIAGIFQ